MNRLDRSDHGDAEMAAQFTPMHHHGDFRTMRLVVARGYRMATRALPPFVAIIVLADRVVSVAANSAGSLFDPTAHAEILAIRRAAKRLRSRSLRGAWLYSTWEPCPMCFSALYKSGFTRLVYGGSTSDLSDAEYGGLRINCSTLCSFGDRPIEIVAGLLREDALAALAIWRVNRDRHCSYGS